MTAHAEKNGTTSSDRSSLAGGGYLSEQLTELQASPARSSWMMGRRRPIIDDMNPHMLMARGR
ncbi:MAG: hypothetical protein Fues2KO_27970 [Fuerstiella sp.]